MPTYPYVIYLNLGSLPSGLHSDLNTFCRRGKLLVLRQASVARQCSLLTLSDHRNVEDYYRACSVTDSTSQDKIFPFL